jgi:hypothetical protein
MNGRSGELLKPTGVSYDLLLNIRNPKPSIANKTRAA